MAETIKQQKLSEVVYELASARWNYAHAKEALAIREAAFRAENAALIAGMEQARAVVERCEAEIRGRQYRADVRSPAPGLTVKLVTRLSYDETQAVDWAITNGYATLLKLEAKAFEKAALGLKPEWVTIEQVPTVSIARDLSGAMGEIEDQWIAAAAEAEAMSAEEAIEES